MAKQGFFTVRVRPELREGLNDLFHGKKNTDAFEELVYSYLLQEIEASKENKDRHSQALEEYKNSPAAMSSVIDSIEYNVKQNEYRMKKLLDVFRKCFPEGYKEHQDEFSQGSFFIGYEDDFIKERRAQ